MRKNTVIEENNFLSNVYFFWPAVFLSIGNYKPNKRAHVLCCEQQNWKKQNYNFN